MRGLCRRSLCERGIRGACRRLLLAVTAGLVSAGGTSWAAEGTWEVLTQPMGPDQVITPSKAVTDVRGNLYVADSSLQRLQMRTPQGVWSVITEPGQVSRVVSMATDTAGNLFVAENGRVLMRTPQGVWSVIASRGEQKLGQVSGVTSLTVDAAGNLFVAEEAYNHRVQMRTPQGVWSVVRQGGYPLSMAVDATGNLFLVHLNWDGGVLMRTPEGDWSVLSSEPDVLYSGELTVDAAGNLFMTDRRPDHPPIRMRTPQGDWSVIAEKGSQLGQVSSGYVKLEADAVGNLYVADPDLQRIQMRTPQGVWSVVASDSEKSYYEVMATDSAGNLFVGGFQHLRMRTPQGKWEVLTKGFQPGQVGYPSSMAVDSTGNLFVGDELLQRVQMRTPQGEWTESHPSFGNFLAVDGKDNLYCGDSYLRRVEMRSPQGEWSVIGLHTPKEMTVDAEGNLYLVEMVNHFVYQRTPQGVWSMITSDGDPDQQNQPGQLNFPIALTVDAAGNLFVGDRSNNPVNNHVQMRTPQGSWSVVPSYSTASNLVEEIAVDARGNLYVSDYRLQQIQMRIPEGEWSVIADAGSQPGQVWDVLNMKMVADDAGTLFTAEKGRVQMRTPEGAWSVIADSGSRLGQVFAPSALALDRQGRLYVGDAGNPSIQRYTYSVPLVYGDLNNDGQVTLSDAVLSLRVVVGLTPSTPDLVKRGDVAPKNPDGTFGDSKLGMGDAVRILRQVVGLEPDL